MKPPRTVDALFHPHKTMDGAGVRLSRVFSNYEVKSTDPFLLLDHFGSDNPDDYIAGFPWHPHRGIETVTYMLRGEVEHGDSLGNKGVIGPGDVQWMTAGSGIIHQEMPRASRTGLEGFQLWVNLPGRRKMTAPKYRGITASEIPSPGGSGARVKLICGEFGGQRGPVTDLAAEVAYLDVELEPGRTFDYPVRRGAMAGIYLFVGTLNVPEGGREVASCVFANLSGEGSVRVAAGSRGARFLLIAGAPLHEPIAWRGPIVMNSEEELDVAFEEYGNGTFIKDASVQG